MKVASMTVPMLATFGEPFTRGSDEFTGIEEQVEVEHEAGYMLATVLHVSRDTADKLNRGDRVTLADGRQRKIQRIGKPADDMVEVVLAA